MCLIYNVCLSDVKRGGFLLSDLHQGYSSVSNHNTCVKFCHNKHFYMCGLAGLCVCVCFFLMILGLNWLTFRCLHAHAGGFQRILILHILKRIRVTGQSQLIEFPRN